MFKSAVLKIPKTSMTEDRLERIKHDLTLKNPEFENAAKYSKWGVSSKIPQFLYFFSETPTDIIIPRNYPLPPHLRAADKTTEGSYADIQFTGSLRDYQDEFFGKIDWKINDAIWEIPCGHGKTSMSLYAASLIKRKTLVLLDTQYLAKQWIERAEQFCGERPFQVTSDNILKIRYDKTIDTYNIYIVTLDMFNSLMSNSRSVAALEFLLEAIGFVIFDEAHRMGAGNYQPIITQIPARKRLALTATFRRMDNVHEILSYHFGEKHYKMKNVFPPAQVFPFHTDCVIDRLIPKFREVERTEMVDGKKKKVKTMVPNTPDNFDELLESIGAKVTETRNYYNVRGKILAVDINKWFHRGFIDKTLKNALVDDRLIAAQIDNYVVEHSGRIKRICSAIDKALDAGRTILVLSKRKEILRTLHRIYSKKCHTALIISETNKMTVTERKDMEENAQVVFGINQIALQGFDMDRLDTLVMLHPVTDTEQPFGRILRIKPGKKQPVVLWPFDQCKSYLNIFNKSHKFVEINAVMQRTVTLKQLDEIL